MRQTKRIASLLLLPALLVFLLGWSDFTYVAAEEGSDKEAIITKIVEYIRGKNVRVHETKLKQMASTVYEECKLKELDYRLVLAVMRVESNFNNDAVSKRGARGLLQIKPSLAKYIAKDAGVDCKSGKCLDEPDKNIKLGVYHLSQLMDDFKNVTTALHAYNAGANKTRGKLFQGTELQNPFAKRVLKEYHQSLSVLPDPE